MATDLKKVEGQASGSQMRITPDEIKLVKAVFKDNEPLLRLFRKIFLPELDPTAPIGQMIDLWMTVDVKDMTPESALINIKARNMLITHIDQMLMTLSLISKQEDMSLDEAKAKVKADSSK